MKTSSVLDHVARVGMLTDGLAHLMVAWLVGRLAFGFTSGAASGAGALDRLSLTTEGRVILYAVAVGFLAQAAWQAVEACFGYRRYGNQRVVWRVLSGVKVLIYAGIVVRILMVAAGSSGSGRTAGLTNLVLQQPAGSYIVGSVGLGTVVVAFFLARFGWVEGFRDTMSLFSAGGLTGRIYAWLGRVGYASRAVAVAMVGLLFVYAGVTDDARKSGGLDRALNDVLQTPVGAPVLLMLALGLASYGLFCFAWARHLDR